MSARMVPLVVTGAINRSDPDIDPHWSDLLLHIRLKAKQIDELRALQETLIAECDDLVVEAVDDGERYRDIARAAQRSAPWVQSVLRRKGVDGPRSPRVRLMTTRAAAAKRALEGDDGDLFPEGFE